MYIYIFLIFRTRRRRDKLWPTSFQFPLLVRRRRRRRRRILTQSLHERANGVNQQLITRVVVFSTTNGSNPGIVVTPSNPSCHGISVCTTTRRRPVGRPERVAVFPPNYYKNEIVRSS